MCFFTMIICDGYLVVFGGNINDSRTNKTFVFRLSMYVNEFVSPLSRLYDLSTSEGLHSDVVIQAQECNFYSQALVLHIRTPLFFQNIINTPTFSYINFPYSETCVRALLLYIYKDEVNPLIPLTDTLNLFSISAIYGISPLMNKLCVYLCRSLTFGTVKTIANYISINSNQMLFHRSEFRQNVDLYTLASPLDELLKKYLTDTLELTCGEKIYWNCIELLASMSNVHGLQDSVKSDILSVNNKNHGKKTLQKTAAVNETSNLN